MNPKTFQYVLIQFSVMAIVSAGGLYSRYFYGGCFATIVLTCLVARYQLGKIYRQSPIDGNERRLYLSANADKIDAWEQFESFSVVFGTLAMLAMIPLIEVLRGDWK